MICVHQLTKKKKGKKEKGKEKRKKEKKEKREKKGKKEQSPFLYLLLCCVSGSDYDAFQVVSFIFKQKNTALRRKQRCGSSYIVIGYLKNIVG